MPTTVHWNKGKTSRQGHVQIPDGLYEEEHGREGFYGPVSHLYRQHPPTSWTRIEGPLKPQAFDGNRLLHGAGADPVAHRTLVLSNDDVLLYLTWLQGEMDYWFRNADGDEIYFVHRGAGKIETDFGPLTYKKGDYIVIPRGTTYRWLAQEDTSFFIIESNSAVRQPDRGLMGQHALYDPALIQVPEPDPQSSEPGKEYEVKIQRRGRLTSVFYPFHPMDVEGWKGDLSVWQLNIHDFCPVMSHKAHLAPSVHTTFLGDGFVVCSFVPRPLESAEGAMRVPFYHRNIDYDEVIFYHDGDFFSRDGIGPGMITFHPQGIHHGPHPKALAGSWDKDWTNEVAVMVDTRSPLEVGYKVDSLEWEEYHMSWRDETQTEIPS